MRVVFIITSLVVSIIGQAQWDIQGISPSEPFDNVHVQKLASDSLGSAFLIWVKHEVKSHRHLVHTESIYVLEGAGEMTVGDSTFTIKEGSFVFVPHNTLHSVVVSSPQALKVLSVQSPEFKGKDRIFAGQLRKED